MPALADCCLSGNLTQTHRIRSLEATTQHLCSREVFETSVAEGRGRRQGEEAGGGGRGRRHGGGRQKAEGVGLRLPELQLFLPQHFFLQAKAQVWCESSGQLHTWPANLEWLLLWLWLRLRLLLPVATSPAVSMTVYQCGNYEVPMELRYPLTKQNCTASSPVLPIALASLHARTVAQAGCCTVVYTAEEFDQFMRIKFPSRALPCLHPQAYSLLVRSAASLS